ncbi:MAG: 4-(cytidine 5'-diphospho)-2-C-methyl-D-erythritol kinase [Alphaproteobacteria bacterium]
MNSISVRAPAKLNLFLHITGKRPNGYHCIESLVVFTEFGDTLDISPADSLTLEIKGEFSSLLQKDAQNNLVLKAAKLLQPYANGQGAKIILHKHIPMGAGLGGGSSDAAATMRALCNVWNICISKDELMAMALLLGSDVPACYEAEPAIISGIGEYVMPVRCDASPFVLLVNPRKPLLTASVYKQFSGAYAASGADIDNLASTQNMLETPAIQLMPEIKDIIEAIHQTKECRLARMSGSGATCFGLYDMEEHAQSAKAQLSGIFPDAWVTVTRIQDGR